MQQSHKFSRKQRDKYHGYDEYNPVKNIELKASVLQKREPFGDAVEQQEWFVDKDTFNFVVCLRFKMLRLRKDVHRFLPGF